MNVKDVLMALLRAEVCGEALPGELKSVITPELLEKVYSLAKAHDLAHIAGQALGKLGVLGNDEVSVQLRRQSMLAMMRYTQLEHEYNRICSTLSEAQIPFIPLKGSVLRAYYPESWMRTSCDIDILVKEENLEAAVSALTEGIGYRKGMRSNHDVALYSVGGVHLELHYTVVEEGRAGASQKVFGRIWEEAESETEMAFKYVLSDAMFYYYHLAHMAKHLEDGGCGIRTFLDLWILNHRLDGDRTAREALLKEGGLMVFAEAAEKLSEVWFSGEEADDLARQLERFVLSGGSFGSVENRVAAKQVEKGGRFGYAVSRIFPPRDQMEPRYPGLQKRKWLLPVYYVIRLAGIVGKGDGKRSLQEMGANASMSSEHTKNAAQLMKKLGF